MMSLAARPLILFATLLLLLRTQAQLAPNEPAPLFDHLLEVNNEWRTQGPCLADGTVRFPSDADRIGIHLACTIELLAARPPVQASKAAMDKRAALLGELRTYTDRRQFPRNNAMYRRTPVFVDEQGNRCAVAHLLYVTGYSALAERIQREMNLSYIHDLPQAELSEWASLHGFTVDELALVQPSYMPEPKDRRRVQAEVQLEQGGSIRVVGYSKKRGTKMRVENIDASGKVHLIARIPFIGEVQMEKTQSRVFFGGILGDRTTEGDLYEWDGRQLIHRDLFPGRTGISRLLLVNGSLVVRAYTAEGQRLERTLSAEGHWMDTTDGAKQ
jgi:hypothetical protein